MKLSQVEFYIGDESRPVIEKIELNENKIAVNKTLFTDQYTKAIKEIDNYLNQVSSEEKNNTNNHRTDKDTVILKQNDSLNNIFAFIGDRGTGKTSCMLSVAEYILNERKKDVISIDMVDPSFLQEKNNILSLIVAKLFKTYSDKTNSDCSQNSFQKSKNLCEKFQETQANLCFLFEKSSLTENDDIEKLNSLAAAVNLRKNIYDLITCYLEFMDIPISGSLLILVDDMDLHTLYAREMVEQIRKYLIHPNVVILMALKMDQLAMINKLHYTKEFSALLTTGKITDDVINKMVDSYLTKLIPQKQRIFLPDLTSNLSSKLLIYTNKEEKKHIETFYSIRQAIPELIYRKTRYLFYNPQGGTSYIVPTNLRELRHLLNLLFKMDDYRTANDDDRPEYNKILFKKYLFETWVPANLDVKGEDVLTELLAVTDSIYINKRVIQLLKAHFSESYFKSDESINSEITEILHDGNTAHNISLGDVMGIIDLIEVKGPSLKDMKLLFMIKTFYSIRLYEYYDEMQDTTPAEQNEDLVESRKSIQKQSNYESLIGGNYVNSLLVDYFPKESSEKSRTCRPITFEILNSLFSKLIEFDYTSDNLSKDEIDLLNLAEFFMLCISFGEKKSSYRIERELACAKSLIHNTKNASFDLNSFFYNIIDIEKCYKRFKNGKALFDNIKDKEYSLVNKLKKNEKDTNFLSRVCIRNIEVLQDFTASTKYISQSTGNNQTILSNFFKKAEEYTIKTYDKMEDASYSKIKFDYLKCMSESLNSENINSDIFDSIFIFKVPKQ